MCDCLNALFVHSSTGLQVAARSEMRVVKFAAGHVSPARPLALCSLGRPKWAQTKAPARGASIREFVLVSTFHFNSSSGAHSAPNDLQMGASFVSSAASPTAASASPQRATQFCCLNM